MLSRLEKIMLWPMCIALALSLDAMGIARYGGKVDPRAEWLIILAAGTLFWVLARKLFSRPIRNHYLFRTRIKLWWERQFPLLPHL